MNRRTFLQTTATLLLAPQQGQPQGARKKIAALSTTYHVRSHSDNFITRFLEGYWINESYYRPRCDIASLYIDQIHAADISPRLAGAYNFPIYPTIGEALTLGGDNLAVDGVLLIGEHGDYPENEKLQKLYPRYEFMKQVVEVFRKSGRSAPVFNDKHLSHDWQEAKWMYEQSRELGFAMMAGSSVPVTFRRPELDFALDTEFEEALALRSGWVSDGGIFHTLELLQCFVERRKGGETGVRAVQHLEGDAVWRAADEGRWSWDLLEAGLARGEKVRSGSPRQIVKNPVACFLEYNDGFQGTVLMLGGLVTESLVAFRVKGQPEIQSTACYSPRENSNNFSPLVHAIAHMFESGQTLYPVERTLLTTGALSFLMESRYQKHRRIETPLLQISYRGPEKSYFGHGRGS